MAIYLVGDIQGCLEELQLLLEQVNFSPIEDELWLTGDLVARGPKSLETLLFLMALGDCVKPVLGNHDLHLLAIHYGLKRAKTSDKLDALLKHHKRDQLMQWLITQPLLRQIPYESAYLSHAGISPQWQLQDAITQAAQAQQKLSSEQSGHWLKLMYGNSPNSWHHCQTDEQIFRFSINTFTRMRFCFSNGELDFDHKLEEVDPATGLVPWFKMSEVVNDNKWVFGHWAALMGHCDHPNLYALDTGCVWGNHMTLLRWHDKKLFTQKAIMNHDKKPS